MKKLFIIRHAKSSWKDLSLKDFDRPLNKRGKSNVPMMGKKLLEKGILPDLIISSPALRALTTAKKLAKDIGYDEKILYNKDIYEADEETLHLMLINVDDINDTIFLIGHNPDLNCLAEKYVDFDENIPTLGIVEIEFHCDSWKKISSKNAFLISFDYPKRS